MSSAIEMAGTNDSAPVRVSGDVIATIPARHTRRWSGRLRSCVVLVDVVAVVGTSLVAVAIGVHGRREPWVPGPALLVAAAACVVALATLPACGSWARRRLAADVAQPRRVLAAFAAAALVLSVAGLALKLDDVRPWVFGVLPATALAVVAERCAVRAVVHAARRRGRLRSGVLLVGPVAAVAELTARIRRAPALGWAVAGVCVPGGGGHCDAVLDGIPVVARVESVPSAVARFGVDLVAVTAASGCSPTDLRRLAWALEGTGAELALDPGLMEVAPARLHLAPVDGLPMLRLAGARLTGVAQLAKGLSDRFVAAVLLVVLAPVLVTVAALVARDGGPVFYRQDRVGLRGQTFRMVKFRSMVVDADSRLAALAPDDTGAGPLFKMRADPRVTPVGAVLRRTSLDELPQLFNVLAGSMSLVGPRPALRCEVEAYGQDVRRRLVVRPGMTGLWQVSGRSDLSWEDAVRLDLRYVEHWSPGLDAAILWRTLGAVTRRDGAY